MADMILKIEENDVVVEMSAFLKSLTEEQRRYMFIKLEGMKEGLQLAKKGLGNCDMQGAG